MFRLLLRWLIEAVSLLLVANVVPDFRVTGFAAALIAAVVIGFINATLGKVMVFFGFPVIVLTLGLFLIVINAVLLKMAAAVSPGFQVKSWKAAFIGALLLSIISTLLNWILI
jgi:putative membrane protein